MNIATIVGSLRAGSLNAGLVRVAAELVPAGTSTTALSIRLPLYDGDLDDDARRPAEVVAFIEAIGRADAVLIATPEYNYGIPGPLKNAIDWASRPAYRSVFAGKKTAVIGAAASVVGSARAQGHLKQVLLGMASEVFPYPEFLVGSANGKFDEHASLTDAPTREKLAEFVTAFVRWCGI